MIARGGERFVLRSFSPVTTIGGGRVLDPFPPRRGAAWPPGLDSPDPAERLVALVGRRAGGLEPAQLPVALGLDPAGVLAAAEREPRLRLAGNRWVLGSLITSVSERAVRLVREYHEAHPNAPGIPLASLRRGLSIHQATTETALRDLVEQGVVVVEDGAARLGDFRPRVTPGGPAVARVVELLTEAGLTPPQIPGLEARIGTPEVRAALRSAEKAGLVEAVERDRYYARPALDRLVSVLREIGAAGEITPPAVRDRLGISRKYLIPLLEWADRSGITIRVGEGRRLRD